MRIKKVALKKDGRISLAVESRGRWVPLLPLAKLLREAGHGDAEALATDCVALLSAGPGAWEEVSHLAAAISRPAGFDDSPRLPFRPLAYRDFMLYEKHAVDAARGYARRFLPRAYKVAAAFEKLSGKTFPRFKPSPLWYERPLFYMGNHLSFVTGGFAVPFPSYSKALDYELELGAVIVRPLRNADPAEAMDAVGGYVIVNDFSARDIQLKEMRSGFGPMKTKNFLNAMSAVVVTADEIPDPEKLSGRVLINGREVARGSFAGPGHSLGEAIAYASLDEDIYAGELVASGTVPGGSGLENGRWVKPGDTLTLEIPPIGSLSNPIV